MANQQASLPKSHTANPSCSNLKSRDRTHVDPHLPPTATLLPLHKHLLTVLVLVEIQRFGKRDARIPLRDRLIVGRPRSDDRYVPIYLLATCRPTRHADSPVEALLLGFAFSLPVDVVIPAIRSQVVVELPHLADGRPSTSGLDLLYLRHLVAIVLKVEGRDVVNEGRGVVAWRGADEVAVVLLGGGADFLVGRPVGLLANLAAVGGGLAASAVKCTVLGAGGRGAVGHRVRRCRNAANPG